MLKKITSIVAAAFLTIATVGCSANKVNTNAGSSSTGPSQVAGVGAKQVLGYAVGFAIGAALAKSIKKDD